MEKERFNRLIEEKLGNINLIVVSNREPTVHEFSGKKIKTTRSVGGLTIALEPIMQNLHGTWIAYGSGSADKAAADDSGKIKLPEGEELYTLKRIFLTKDDINGYYYGYSNSILWPLCHIVYRQPVFDPHYFEVYERVNKKFADSIIEEINNTGPSKDAGINNAEQSKYTENIKINNIKQSKNTVVWLQDYHLALCAKYIKEYDNAIKTSIFWHIPWPNPEVFTICPEKKELLDGLLSNDLIGFQIIYYCQNFLRTCEWELEARINWADYTVTYKGHVTKVMPFQISVDAKNINDIAMSKGVNDIAENIKNNDIIEPSYEYLALSVDRLDYTKGIIEKFKAIDRFLEKYSKFQGKFVFLQLGVISRTLIEAYKRFNDQVLNLAEDINWKYKTGDWYPIVQFYKQLDFQTYITYYKICDVMIVSPLQDGMNLVAKEYVMSNVDYKGMLVLSRFAGSAKELKDAVLVNPFSVECFADAINEALIMNIREKERRTVKMQNIIMENNIYDWAYNFLTALCMI